MPSTTSDGALAVPAVVGHWLRSSLKLTSALAWPEPGEAAAQSSPNASLPRLRVCR